MLRLPRELRDMIWKFATEDIAIRMVSVRRTKVSSHGIYDSSRKTFSPSPNRGPSFRLLFARGLSSAICRQMRDEAAYLQIQRTLFRFSCVETLDQFGSELSLASSMAVWNIGLQYECDSSTYRSTYSGGATFSTPMTTTTGWRTRRLPSCF